MKKLIQRSFLVCAAVLMLLPLLPMTRAAGIPPRDQVVWATGYWQGAASLNPWNGNPAYGIATMYETLFGFNAETGTLIPVIGTSYYWEAPGSTKCHVLINPDAKFSDGSAVTAADVAFSYQLARDYTSNFGPDMTSRIATIAVENASAVVFTTQPAYPHTGFLDVWLRSNLPIVKADIWAVILATQLLAGKTLDDFTNDWFDSSFNATWKVSSGPYFPYYRSATKDVEIYQLRSDWWGSGKIHTDLPSGGVPEAPYIGLTHYASNTLQDVAFLSGDIDYFAGYMANIWQAIATHPNINTWFGQDPPYQLAASSMLELVVNWNYFPFNQLWYRLALASAIPYDDCSNTGASGYLQRARQGFVDDRIAPLLPVYNASIQSKYAIEYNMVYAVGNLSANCYLDTANLTTDGHWSWYANVPTANLGDKDARTGVTIVDAISWLPGTQTILEGPASESGILPCICPSGWTDVEIATDLWSASFTSMNVSMARKAVDYGTWTSQFQEATFLTGMMCSSPKLMNDPVVLFNGYRGAIQETGAAQFNRNTSNWYGTEAQFYEACFSAFETAEPGSVSYKMYASFMQELLASVVPTIPLYGNGFWYAFSDTYFTGFVENANKYNQITTVWDNDNMAIRTRLIINLRSTGVVPLDLTLIFGIVAIGAIVALVIAVIVMRKRGA